MSTHIISPILDKRFSVCLACVSLSVTLRDTPLDSETLWTEDFWSTIGHCIPIIAVGIDC